MNTTDLALWWVPDLDNAMAFHVARRAYLRRNSPEARCHLTDADLVPPWISAQAATVPLRCYVVGPTLTDRLLAVLRARVGLGGRR